MRPRSHWSPLWLHPCTIQKRRISGSSDLLFLNILPVCQVFFVKTIGYFFEIRFSWKDALSKYLSIHMCKKSFTWQINSFHFFIGSYWRFFHNSGQSWEKLFFGHVGRDPIRPTHKQDLISSQIFWSFMYRKFQRCHWTFKSDLH